MPHSYENERPTAGISSLGIAFPSLYLPVEELAGLRGVDPGKLLHGLGCREIALCGPGEGAASLAARAARRALDRWPGNPEQIGLLAVGTETALDMSRPLSAWVADELDLRGALRSYEVKHACYGGTLALRQALEWKLAGAAQGKAALVIATDVALYAPGDPGEPTQGAGAVAMVIDQPTIAAIDPVSYPWSEPAFDFWRPVGESYPRVDGPFSLDCYKKAAAECFEAWVGSRTAEDALGELAALCFHVPFPKMVQKAVFHTAEALGLSEESAKALFASKVDPTLGWNRRCGNAYTASLWIAVAEALSRAEDGEHIVAFSYGSGFGAELLSLVVGPEATGTWAEDVQTDFTSRSGIDAAAYDRLRGGFTALTA